MDWIQLGTFLAVAVTALTPIFIYLKRKWIMRLTARQKEMLRVLSEFEVLNTYTCVLAVDLAGSGNGNGVRSEEGVVVPYSYLHDVWSLCLQHELLREETPVSSYDSVYALTVKGQDFLQNNVNAFREKVQPSHLPDGIWARMGPGWRWLVGV